MRGSIIPNLSKGLSKYVEITLILSAVLNLTIAIIMSAFGNQMYPFFIILYIWIAVYVFFVVTLIRRETTSERPLIRREFHLAGLVLITVFIRLIFISKPYNISLDALWYLDYGKFMHMGLAPYTGFYFPYPPVFAYFIYAITTVFQGVEGFRLFAIAMDAAVLVVLWKLVQQEVGLKWASTAVLVYAFLPISIIETGWNGHFEPLVSLLILTSLWFLTKQKWGISGGFLSLSIATKIYPMVVYPIFLMYIKDWRNRLWFTICTVFSGVLVFAPILLFRTSAGAGGGVHTTQSTSLFSLFESLVGYLFERTFPVGIITVGLTLSIIVAVIYLMRQIGKDDPLINTRLYWSAIITVGLLIITIGVIACLYAFLPISRLIYWRYPMDIGIVRGVTAVCAGLLITIKAYHEKVDERTKQISRNSLLVLVGAVSLVYGWYLLWSIPFLLLMPDKRVSYAVILCLLLIYPNYTSDNFANLGFSEPRQWQDEFDAVDGWTSHVNINGIGVNASLVSTHVDSDGTNGRFWFDTRSVTSDEALHNVSFSFTKEVAFDFQKETDFVTKITSSWDPPFGRYADLSLSIEGTDGGGEPIDGVVIPRTSMFTNLTYTHWRYDFRNLASPTHDGTITLLNLTIYPVQRVDSCYKIDFFYTTHAGVLSPIYFILIPSLIAVALISVVVLNRELEREQRTLATSNKNHMPTDHNSNGVDS
jgi:hypothetical protein